MDHNGNVCRFFGRIAAMRPARVLLVLVIAGATAFAATTLSKGDAGPQERAPRDWDYPRPGSKKATPRPQPQHQALDDALAQYAAECAEKTGITVPDLTCRKGEEVKGQKMAEGLCRTPDVLAGACDPGSRFQVLEKNNDAHVVAHCRKRGAKSGEFYQDIAIIQYNKKNGAICFYQALAPPDLPGNSIPSPSKGRVAWSDGKSKWMTPKQTYNAGCTGCHDNGGFIRTPYIVQTKMQVLPSTAEGYNNKDNPLAYVGKEFKRAKSWTIEIAEGPTCTGCHRMAVSNHPKVINTFDLPETEITEQLGTSLAFGVVSTAKQQAAQTPHGEVAPDGEISKAWMPPPGHEKHDPAALAAARKYRRCAHGWIKSKFTQAPSGCTIEQFAFPFEETD
jgi:hypothetical protein